MNENTNVRLIKSLDVTDLAGEKVMIDFETGKYFLLKGTANDIWEYIQTPISIKEIKEKLLLEYNVSADECLESIISFLNNLEEYNFVSLEA